MLTKHIIMATTAVAASRVTAPPQPWLTSPAIRYHRHLIRCSVLTVCSPAPCPPPSATAASLPGSSECTNRPSRERPGLFRSVLIPVMLARTWEGGAKGKVEETGVAMNYMYYTYCGLHADACIVGAGTCTGPLPPPLAHDFVPAPHSLPPPPAPPPLHLDVGRVFHQDTLAKALRGEGVTAHMHSTCSRNN